MAEPPVDENLDDPAANQSSSGTSGEEVDGGDSIIDHSNTLPKSDMGGNGHSKADLQRYPTTNTCELAIKERNEGIATSTDATTSLPLITIHGPYDISPEGSGRPEEVRDNFMTSSDRLSMGNKSIGSFDNCRPRTLITDATHDEESWQDHPYGRDHMSTLEMRDESGAGPSNLPTNLPILTALTLIYRKDCKLLLRLFDVAREQDYDLEYDLEYDRGGSMRTSALHIAAMQGCFPLAKLLLDNVSKTEWLDSYIAAVDPRSGLTAFQMAHDITGNRSIAEFIKDYQNKESSKPHLLAAHPRTLWYCSLEKNLEDKFTWINMQDLLRWNSRLLLETFHGISVLHLAILRDDLELVKEVMVLFGPGKKIKWGESYYPSELSWELMCEINPKNIDFDQINRPLLLDFMLVDQVTSSVMHTEGCTALQLATKLGRSTIMALLKQYEDSPEQVAPSLPKFSPNPYATILEFLQQNWDVHPEWEEGYMKDVDFNFEVEPRLSLLRFHHACKDPLKFKEFFECAQLQIKDLWTFSSMTHDGQGRTMYHILADHHTDDKPPGWALEEIFSLLFSPNEGEYELYDAVDARGRSLIHILLTKNYLLKNIFIQPSSKFTLLFKPKYDYDTVFTFYHIAYILKQTSVAQHILTIIRKLQSDYMDDLKKRFNCDIESWLRIAVSTGNYTILGVLLGLPSCDPTIAIDGEGKTTLHYVANGFLLDHSNFFKFPKIMDFFSTIKDVGDFKTKWTEERKKSLVIFPSSKDSNSMDVEVQFNMERKACILMLLQVGCDLSQVDKDGEVPKVGPTKDATFQSWWYDMVVKDTTDQKNGFNQAGNALSVVGTLVAATSYIEPLQPPMSYTEGFVNITEKLVEVFMATNTMAFYFAMASVMFAVVPSLPMPRESVMSELKRARHMVSLSLCFLLVATIMIMISFAAASLVVIQHHQYGLRFGPTVIGWFVCIVAIISFLIRVLRLMYFENPIIKRIYRFSFTVEIKKFGIAIKRRYSNLVA